MNPSTHPPLPSQETVPTPAPEIVLTEFVGAAHPGELWLAQDRSERQFLVRIIYRETMSNLAEFEICFARLKAWAALTRGLPRHLQTVHVSHRASPDCLYCILEAPDPVPRQRVYSPDTLQTELDRRGLLAPREAQEVGLTLTEALEQLHRSGFVHGSIRLDNVFRVGGESRLGPPDLRLGLPGTYLARSLRPEADVRAMTDMIEDLIQKVERNSPTICEAIVHRLMGWFPGRRRPASPNPMPAAALRRALRDAREGRTNRGTTVRDSAFPFGRALAASVMGAMAVAIALGGVAGIDGPVFGLTPTGSQLRTFTDQALDILRWAMTQRG